MAKSVNTTYHPNATARCSNCKSIYTLGSTAENLVLEICANCHPFFTGVEGNIDTAGRIDTFYKKMSMVSSPKKAKVKKVRKLRQTLDSLGQDESEEESTKNAPKVADNLEKV
jgi:large subunit ribosomal protein L31